MNKLLNNLLGMYKQAKLNKKAEEDLIEVGWGLYTNDEYEIKENALYGGGEIKEVNKSFWDKINKDIEKVEMWFLKDGYKQFFAKVRDEGHGKDSELGGTAWMTKQQIQDFIDRAERTDGNRYTIREEIGGINVPFDYDETLFFTLDIIVDEETLDDLNIESKRVSKNKKQSSKKARKSLHKKAISGFSADVMEINERKLDEIRNTAKDMGDEIWARINENIVKIIAYGYEDGKLKIVYREPYYGKEEIEEMYENADEVSLADFQTLELQREAKSSHNLAKKAYEDLNKEYKLLGNGLPTFDFNKKIIDFLDGINKKFDKFCVKIYGKIVCFNEIKNKKLITDKGEEFDYRDFGTDLLLKIYNKINNSKQSSNSKTLLKKAENFDEAEEFAKKIIEENKYNFTGHTDMAKLENNASSMYFMDSASIKEILDEAKKIVSELDKDKDKKLEDADLYFGMKDRALLAEKVLEEKTKQEKQSSKNTKLTKKAYHMEQEDLIKETNEEIKELARNFTNGFKNSWMGVNVKGDNFYAFTTIEKEDEDGFTYLDINNGEFSDGYGLDKYFHPYDYWYDIKNDKLYKINWNILEKKLEEDAKFYTSSSKAKLVRKQAKYEETVQGDEKVKDSAKSFGYDIKFAGHYGKWIYYYLIDERGNIIRDDKEYQKVYDEMKKRIDDDIDIDNYAFAKGLIEEVDGELMRVPTIVISEYTLLSNHKDREENTGLEEFKRDFNLSSSTKKKAVLQESENGLGYVLPNGSVVYPGDEAYLKSEYKANKQMLEKDKKELERLEGIIKKYPDINFDKNKDSVKFQIPRVKKGIEYLELFNETIEDILNAFKNKKMGKQATKKQAEKVLTLKEAIGKDESEFKNMEDIVDYMNHLPFNANKSSWTVEGFGGNSIDVENLSNGEKATIKLKKNFNSRYATRQNKLSKSATIKHENGVYNVYSESGKCLGKGYKTKEEAEKRLKQVEYFKHKNASRMDWEFPGYETEPVESKIEWLYTHNVNYNNTQYDYIWKLRETLKGEHVDVDENGEKIYLNKDDIEDILYYLKHHNKNYRGDQYWIIDDLKVEDFIKNLKSNKRTSLKQVVISKMAKNLKDIPDSVKKNILSDLVYVILTGKGSFAYKTVAKKLETIIKELGYGDKLKANEDGSLPTMEIVELISKEPKAMELAGKFANITRAF